MPGGPAWGAAGRVVGTPGAESKEPRREGTKERPEPAGIPTKSPALSWAADWVASAGRGLGVGRPGQRGLQSRVDTVEWEVGVGLKVREAEGSGQ